MFRRVCAMMAATLLVVLAGWLLFAHVARATLRDHLAAWALLQRSRGWTVAYAEHPTRAGIFFPGLSLREVRLAGAADVVDQGFAATADRLDATIDFADPRLLRIRLEGVLTLRIGGAAPLRFAGALTEGAARLDNQGRLVGVSLLGRDLASVAPWVVSIGSLDASAALDERGATFGIRAEAIGLPVDYLGLGQHLSDVTLEARLDGWPPTAGSRAARADIWRAEGGAIDITQLMLGWGPLGAVLHGRLVLDAALQPDGTGTLDVHGFDPLLRRLGAAGVADALAFMAPGGEVPLDVRLKHRALALDRIRVATLPRVAW